MALRQSNYVLARRKSWRALALGVALAVVSAAQGEERLESLAAGGVIYSNVTVVSRTPTHITFKHTHGFSTVKLGALTSDNQAKIGYTPPPPPKRGMDYVPDLTALTQALNDPRLQLLEKEVRAEVARVLAEDDKVIIYSAAGGAGCIYLLFCLAAVKICRKTTVRPGLWVWLPGFQWISLLKAAGMSPWFFFLLLIPPVNLVVMIVWCFKICRTRQKSQALGFFLLVPVINIFVYFYLAFSSQKNAPAAPGRGQPQKLRLSFQH